MPKSPQLPPMSPDYVDSAGIQGIPVKLQEL